MKTLFMKTSAIGLLLGATFLLQIGCDAKRVERGVGIGISALSAAAVAQTVTVENLRVEGLISEAEATDFLAWANSIPVACDAAVDVLKSSESLELRLTKITSIFATVPKNYVVRSDASREVKIAYVAILSALDAARVQLKLAQN